MLLILNYQCFKIFYSNCAFEDIYLRYFQTTIFWASIPNNTRRNFDSISTGKPSFLKHEIFATYLRGNS